MKNQVKYAVIFGAESGLAKAATEKLVENGFIVFAFDIKYEATVSKGNVTYSHADVTSDSDLSAAFALVSAVTDKVDVISNFSGVVILGSLVELPADHLTKILSVNLVGTYRVNEKFFPLALNAGGRIINISSEYSRITAIPFHAYYALTKRALDVYNDSLRRELKGSPVSVTAIRPGAFRTNMQAGIIGQFDTLVNETKRYKKPLLKMKSIMLKELDKARSPELFAKTYLKAALRKRPARYYSVNNSFKMKVLSALPATLVDFIFGVYFK